MTCFAIRMVLVLSIINWCSTQQVDFVLAFPWADIEFNMHMDILQNIETRVGSRTTHIINFFDNLYGKSKLYRVWNQHLAKGLEETVFCQSRVDDCVFY